MLVTVERFNAYTGNYEADDQAVALKETYLKSAQTIVSDFLRYDPEQKVWTEGGAPGAGCPELILLAVMKIAALNLMEAGENIGITGKSMPDNSRTFINYSGKGSYITWLRPIQNFREVAF